MSVTELSQAGTLTGSVSRNIVGTPSVKQLAADWLRAHPEHRAKSTRWLEQNAKPMGVTVGKSTWGRAKNE